MNVEALKQILLSQTAALIYELLILAVLVLLIILVSRQRKQRKRMVRAAYEQKQKQELNAALENRRRRCTGNECCFISIFTGSI